MSDLDQALRCLAALPAPSELATIDDAVLAGLAASRREAAAGSRLMGFAAALALVVGLVYTLPNFFGEAPAIQVSSGKATLKLDVELALGRGSGTRARAQVGERID